MNAVYSTILANTLHLSKKMTVLPLTVLTVFCAGSSAAAASATTTLTVSVVVPSVCQVKTVETAKGGNAFDFRCNVKGSGAVSVENTVYGALSANEDCRDKRPSMLIPLKLEVQRLYLCGIQSGETPLVTFTVP